MEDLIDKLQQEAGLTPDESMMYYQTNAIAQHVNLLPPLHNGERAEFVRDFQNILTRILARPGLRRVQKSSKGDDAGNGSSEGEKGEAKLTGPESE